MIYAILASGQSLTAQQVDDVRQARTEGKIKGIIAVSNVGLDLCIDADALVSHDANWWHAYAESFKFEGRKFSAKEVNGVERFDIRKLGIPGGLNSGLLAMYIARDIYHAKKLILLGFDMHGTHYFGAHPEMINGRRLITTTNRLFDIHKKQFNDFSGCEIFNCTPESALAAFPKVKLRDII